MKKQAIIITLILMELFANIYAEDRVILNSDEIVNLVIKNNKDITKAKIYSDSLYGRYVEERSAALPNFAATSYYMKDYDRSSKATIGTNPKTNSIAAAEIQLSQVIYSWGQVTAAIRAAEVGLKYGEDKLEFYKNIAVKEALSTYYDILLGKELEKISKDNLNQKERHLMEVEKKFTAGIATEYDVISSRVAVDNAKPDLLKSTNFTNISIERLKKLLSIEDKKIHIEGSLNITGHKEISFDDFFKQASANRAEIKELQHRLKVSEELLNIAKAGNKPRLDFKGSVGYKYMDTGFQSEKGTIWSAGVYMNFPFFDGKKTDGKVIQAKGEINDIINETAKLKDDISLEIRNLIHKYRESYQIVSALDTTILQAEKLLDMAEKGYKFGVKTKLEVDDAQLNLTQAKGNRASALRDYYVNKLYLYAATGNILENYKDIQ